MGAERIRELAQHPQDLTLLVSLGRTQGIAQLDDLGRLQEYRGARRRLVVHDATDARAGGRADRDHIAALADRDGCVWRAVRGIEAHEHGLELLDQALAGFPYGPAGASEPTRRSVPELPRGGIERLSEAALELPRRRLHPQRGGPRRVGRELGQIGRRDARRGEALAHEHQRLTLERAARHRQ